MAKVIYQNVNMGGIADSDYLGGKNSVAEMVGFDIHSEVGVMKVNQALTKESGSTVDDFVKASVPCSDGKTYLFGSTAGKIWSRDSGGTYALEATASPAAGSAGIIDAREYQGYIYYAMQNRIGRWQIGTAWSTRNDNWATFLNGDAEFHPMLEINLVLYIGDGSVLAQVDAGTFSNNALDIQDPLRIKSLGQLGTDILLGTYISSNIVSTQIIRWNTWSVSFTNTDPIPEVGINCFLPMDNFVLVNAGTKGNLYLYDGVKLEPYKQIKGTWGGNTKTAIVHPNAKLNFNGLPLFGLSNLSGNPANLGVYSLGRANRNYSYVLNCEVGISTGHLSNIEIGCITPVGTIFLVSWKDTTSGTTYGVDKLDLSAKYSAPYVITRVLMADRFHLLKFGTVDIGYRSLPTNTTFGISVKKNNGSMTAVDAGDCVDDTDRQVFRSKVDVSDATKVQIKIAPTVSGNTAPEIEMWQLDVE